MNALTAWREYAAWQAWLAREAHYEALNCCPSCGGFGDTGVDECGQRYICYACGGTGNYYAEVA